MRKKLKDSSGLTFVEMLCAVVILVLLCLLMDTGMQMAMTNYRAITSASETQLLLSSLADALTDKLRYAVVTKDISGVYSISVGGIVETDDKIVSGIVVDEGKVKVDGKTLLPDGAYGAYEVTPTIIVPPGTEPTKIVKLDVSGSDGSIVTFTVNLKVKEKSGDIGAEMELTVRCLNPLKEEAP